MINIEFLGQCAVVLLILIYLRYRIVKNRGINTQTKTKRLDETLLEQNSSDHSVPIKDDTKNAIDEYFTSKYDHVIVLKRKYRWDRMISLDDVYHRSKHVKETIKLLGFFTLETKENIEKTSLPESFDKELTNKNRESIKFKSAYDIPDEYGNYIYLFTVRMKIGDHIGEYIIRTGGTENLKSRMSTHASSCRRDSNAFRPGKAIAYFLLSNPKAYVRVYSISIKAKVVIQDSGFLNNENDQKPENETEKEDVFVSIHSSYENKLTDIYIEVSKSKFNDLQKHEERPLLCINVPRRKRVKAE